MKKLKYHNTGQVPSLNARKPPLSSPSHKYVSHPPPPHQPFHINLHPLHLLNNKPTPPRPNGESSARCIRSPLLGPVLRCSDRLAECPVAKEWLSGKSRNGVLYSASERPRREDRWGRYAWWCFFEESVMSSDGKWELYDQI